MADTKKVQVKAEKIGSIVYETYIYRSPRGDGELQYEYRKSGTDMERKLTHVGPEPIASYDWQVVTDQTVTEKQQTGTTNETLDVVKYVETAPGSGILQRIVVQEQHSVPVYSNVQVVVKHPYKALYFGL